MDFRRHLLATLRAVRPVLDVPGVLVVGSEVPNLLQAQDEPVLVVSKDVDIGVPVAGHEAVKERLPEVRLLKPSADEPSVWVPGPGDLLEVNFVGIDPGIKDPVETYVRDDPALPLLVFGALSLLRPAEPLVLGDLRVPIPRTAGLLLEKLLTERSGRKGDRDLLVAAGLVTLAREDDLSELESEYRTLPGELRYAVRSNLTVLSLMAPHADMPDPRPRREDVARLLRRLERGEEDRP